MEYSSSSAGRSAAGTLAGAGPQTFSARRFKLRSLYKDNRRAAVGEARARLAQEQAELDAKINEIAFDAEQARQQVIESRQSLAVYRDRLLPTAEQSIESARASYMAGRLDFLRLIESQRQLLALQDAYYAALAEFHQRLAALDRAVGAPPPQMNSR